MPKHDPFVLLAPFAPQAASSGAWIALDPPTDRVRLAPSPHRLQDRRRSDLFNLPVSSQAMHQAGRSGHQPFDLEPVLRGSYRPADVVMLSSMPSRTKREMHLRACG
ncbi:hypothetical protein [Sphingomonas gilva]|uniref:hypothetical protein n=1 Tax=Sphingomonas gilva TaxID=2305907 RepID=UPI0011C3F37C|nr:hypothetical protein [Sphingomonas gilva]